MGLRVFRKQTAGGGGGGTPGGTSGQIQYNNAGAFGGISASGTGNVVRTSAMDAAIAAAITASEMVQVDTHADLPVTVGTPAVGTLYYVRTSTSSYWLFNKKPSGIWRRATNNGNLDDWVRAGDLADILPPIATQAEAEAGTGTAILSWTPERVKQAILAFLTWSNVSGKPSTFAPSAHTHPASEVADSTATGRAVLTATDAAAARTAISAADASHSHGDATGSAAGFMSAADKSKLDGVASGATNYANSNVLSYLIGLLSDGQYLRRSGASLTGGTPAGGSSQLVVPLRTEFSTYTNLPASVGFLGGTTGHQFVVKADLTNFTQVRLIVNKQGVAGATGSKLVLRYHTSFSTTASTYSDIGTSAVEVAVDTTNAVLDTGWINLAAGAKADVMIALLGYGGDGVVDPTFGAISAQFK